MLVVDLNADLGEREQQDTRDTALMPYITSANIACGAHAGNVEVMHATVAAAVKNDVRIGAHPGLADRATFGRREVAISPDEVRSLIADQVGLLASIAAQHGASVHHVKPHGALYNMAARDLGLATAVAHAVADIDDSLVLVGLAGSTLITAARTAGLRAAEEGFADRAYCSDGSLAPRGGAAAVLSDADTVATRAVAMVRHRRVLALDGTIVPISVDTICIHGDTPGAVTLAQHVRAALERAGVRVTALR